MRRTMSTARNLVAFLGGDLSGHARIFANSLFRDELEGLRRALLAGRRPDDGIIPIAPTRLALPIAQ
jgi:hypothetical protein